MTDCTTDGALMDYLWTHGLLCEVCEETPWTVWAKDYPQTRLCAACAQDAPQPEARLVPQPYSVLLLYPDDLETYYTHVWAEGPGAAIGQAQADASVANAGAIPADAFAVLLVLAGHVEAELTASDLAQG